MFIALFVWIGAAQESRPGADETLALGGIPVSRAMVTDFHTLQPDDTLARAVELTLEGTQRDFPVVEDDRVVGVLRQNDMLAALAARARTARGRGHADRFSGGGIVGNARCCVSAA